MARKKKDKSASSGERTLTFERARWKHWVRYFGVSVIFMLNFSLVAATIEIHSRQVGPDIWRELLSFVLVAFFDLTVLLPTLLEVDRVWATPDRLIMSTLFWKTRVPWADIKAFYNPIWFNFAVVRTARCLYLINKRDVKPLDELIQTIDFKRTKVAG